VFVDTPGFQSHVATGLAGAMNRSVTTSLAEVDTVVWVVVAGRYTDDDVSIARRLPTEKPLVVAINKVDLLGDSSALLPYIEKLATQVRARAIVPVSAQKSYQLDMLIAEIERTLPVSAALYPEEQVTDRDERYFASEFIREKVFRTLGDEVPYATTVLVDRFEERGSLRRIHATILVEKPSHKAILIGTGGERLKAIASGARKDLEKLFAAKVYLQVWVKVRRGWSEDNAELKRLGYA
jgi:GTP-binding protein Era